MPKYELTWTHDNADGEPTIIRTSVTGSSPDKAAENALKACAVTEDEIAGAVFSFVELDEDGEPV